MRAAVFHGPGNISVDSVPDPQIEAPTDAIVEVEAAGVCGSDLWTYRGESSASPGARIGHEFVGRVVAIGSDVSTLKVGDWVIAPFRYSCGTCIYCTRGLSSSCVQGGFWSREVVDAGQGEYVRVPFADGTLIRTSDTGERPDPTLIASMVALTDVMATGYHAARSAHAGPGGVTCIIGDGAVAICGVLAARLLGADRVIVLGSTHESRQNTMRQVGADDVLSLRGDDAVAQVREMTGGLGAESVMECVGTGQSFATALGVVGDGGSVGYVGLPHDVSLNPALMFARNITLAGGVAPARSLIPFLLPHILRGALNPGVVFTAPYSLTDIPRAYADLDRRLCVKPLIAVKEGVSS